MSKNYKKIWLGLLYYSISIIYGCIKSINYISDYKIKKLFRLNKIEKVRV
ncbi:hypothetical protein SAMN02746066_04151 [Anaerosporobacter mobilis DSM 15930]|uniref:Lipoprotein n=1 Tax=Anaerosporobacter mobilis DSM 15930 TaxID=1120996 RepID=A0A1M7N144_9FIRM|nr:hypothetical protein SAMN02746066_04151 [Anaerosporobacter mobilis DSM 15930]